MGASTSTLLRMMLVGATTVACALSRVLVVTSEDQWPGLLSRLPFAIPTMPSLQPPEPVRSLIKNGSAVLNNRIAQRRREAAMGSRRTKVRPERKRRAPLRGALRVARQKVGGISQGIRHGVQGLGMRLRRISLPRLRLGRRRLRGRAGDLASEQAAQYLELIKQLEEEGTRALGQDAWRMIAIKEEMKLWRRLLPETAYAREFPCVKLYRVLDAPADKVMELLVDSSRVQEYNRYSQGRIDVAHLGPNTKIVRNRTRPPLSKKAHEFCTLMHLVKRDDGSQVMLTRYIEHPEVPRTGEFVRSEIVLGVTEVRPLAKDPRKAEFTTISHVKSSGVPPFIAEQVSFKGLVDFALSVEDALTSNKTRALPRSAVTCTRGGGKTCDSRTTTRVPKAKEALFLEHQGVMESLYRANQLFVEEDYDSAIVLYTEYLRASPDDALALASRAAAYLKIGKHREALQDANNATRLQHEYEIAFHRKGLAAFALGEYEAAKQAFERGLALWEQTAKPDTLRKYKTWIRKCDAEIESDDQETSPSAEPSNAATATSGGASSSLTSGPAAPVRPAAPPLEPSIKYQYYQTDSYMTVTVLQKNVKPDDAQITIEPRKLRVVIRKDGVDVVVLDKVLFDEVVVEESSTKYFQSKVEIKMKKKHLYSWSDLQAVEGSSTGVSTTGAAAPSPASAPAPQMASKESAAAKIPRPYASHRDWDTVEKEVEKELEAEQPQGEEALHKLFRDIYAKGSDETRRAMIKSFQTSGGTVLSTNWDEVAKKDYEQERQAPDGMEWQTWEGKKLAK